MNKLRKDEGASLILAILIVTTISLVVVALLTQGSSSLRVTLAVRSVADSSYSADGAAQIAINNLRAGTGFGSNPNEAGFNNGNDGAGCFGNSVGLGNTDNLPLSSSFYTPYGSGGGNSAYVQCTPETGTGAQGSPVIISSTNKPGQAILTLDTTNSDGLDFGHSSETNTVHGSVTSDSGLQVKNNSSLNVTGTGVSINANSATGGCQQAVQVNGVNTPCGTTSIPDPNYAAPSVTPAFPATPTCPTSNNGPEIFYPGVYTMTPDTAGVGSQTITITVSSGSAGTFTPTLTAPTGYPVATAQAWNVTPAAMQTSLRNSWGIPVTVTGTQTTATVAGSYAITFPGVLGTTPALTVAGVGLGVGKTVTRSTTTAGKASCAPTTVGWYYFAPQDSVTTGVYYFNWSGSWGLSGTAVGGTLATNKLGTTAGGSTIAPAGNALAPTQPGACVNPIKDPNAVGDEFVFGGTAQLHPSSTSLKEFCATYNGTTSIPTVVYGLKSSVGTAPAPVVPAQSTCVVNSGCAMITISNGDHAVIYFEGFVYAPRAYITLDVNNATQPFFNFGLITNTLHLGQTGSGCGTCAYINLPDNSLGYGQVSTIVDLTVYLCPGAASCTPASGAVALKARVQLYDSTGTPVAGQRGVNILSWSEQR
ncbi:MAG: hypothetical protein JWR52_3362 [Marmoricola sp.]|nr:hypothetical protein [Marmoricola sp.]